MCVKLHTVCELTHSVQNFTGVPCLFNMKKFLSLEKFYTHAVTDVTDKYQVWLSDCFRKEMVCSIWWTIWWKQWNLQDASCFRVADCFRMCYDGGKVESSLTPAWLSITTIVTKMITMCSRDRGSGGLLNLLTPIAAASALACLALALATPNWYPNLATSIRLNWYIFKF